MGVRHRRKTRAIKQEADDTGKKQLDNVTINHQRSTSQAAHSMGAGREQAQSTELPASPTRGVTPPILNVFARAPNNSFEYQISHTSGAESRVWLMKTASDESIGKQSIDHWQRTMMVRRRSGREGAGRGRGRGRHGRSYHGTPSQVPAGGAGTEPTLVLPAMVTS